MLQTDFKINSDFFCVDMVRALDQKTLFFFKSLIFLKDIMSAWENI